jgi:transposase
VDSNRLDASIYTVQGTAGYDFEGSVREFLQNPLRICGHGRLVLLKPPSPVRSPAMTTKEIKLSVATAKDLMSGNRDQFREIVRDLLQELLEAEMTAPGVGPVMALTYCASINQPQRFVHSRAVGAHVGLTPRRHQSGETDYDGGISKSVDTMLPTMLYEAAQVC